MARNSMGSVPRLAGVKGGDVTPWYQAGFVVVIGLSSYTLSNAVTLSLPNSISRDNRMR